MGTWTITTTATEDAAIDFAYEQAQKPPPGLLTPPIPPPPTVAAFFQLRVTSSAVAPLVAVHQAAQTAELVGALASVPAENRAAAQKEIEAVIVEQGGAVKVRSARYLWSSNTAAPPRVNSVEADATDANLATLGTLTFDDLDADNVTQMAALLALPVNTLIRIEDAADPANYLVTILHAAPIQRQGADGYVELLVTFSSRGGTFAALDTKPVTCAFS